MTREEGASLEARAHGVRAPPLRAWSWAVMACLTLGTWGCDPPAPHLTGEVILREDLALPPGATLVVQAGVARESFSQVMEPAPDVPGSARETFRQSLALQPGQRRIAFDLGAGIGSSQSKHWRVVAWVSSGAAEALQQSSLVGHADVELPAKCGPFGLYGYCEGVSGIQVALLRSPQE